MGRQSMRAGSHTSAASTGAGLSSGRAEPAPNRAPDVVRRAENRGADTVEDWLPSRYLPSPESERRLGSDGRSGCDTTSDEPGELPSGAAPGTPPGPATGPAYGPAYCPCAYCCWYCDQAARSASCKTPKTIRYRGQLRPKEMMSHSLSSAVMPKTRSIAGPLMR